MSSDDIVARLRAWSDNAKEQGVEEVVDGLRAAADEIDELRMEICYLRASSTNATDAVTAEMRDHARSRGWDCFREER
jgi:hypothetical protein